MQFWMPATILVVICETGKENLSMQDLTNNKIFCLNSVTLNLSGWQAYQLICVILSRYQIQFGVAQETVEYFKRCEDEEA